MSLWLLTAILLSNTLQLFCEKPNKVHITSTALYFLYMVSIDKEIKVFETKSFSSRQKCHLIISMSSTTRILIGLLHVIVSSICRFGKPMPDYTCIQYWYILYSDHLLWYKLEIRVRILIIRIWVWYNFSKISFSISEHWSEVADCLPRSCAHNRRRSILQT